MTISQKPYQTGNINNVHPIYLLPTVLDKAGDLDYKVTAAMMLAFVLQPMIDAQSVEEELTNRVQNLNPIGALYNERQSFGANSSDWSIDGYISDMKAIGNVTNIFNKFIAAEPSLSFDASELDPSGNTWESAKSYLNIPINRFRLSMLRYCVYNAVPVFIITNTSWDIITIDKFKVKEIDDEVYTYSIRLEGKSVLRRKEYGIAEVAKDTVINSVLSSLAIVF